MRPNEGWNVDKVEQTFNALLEDGKIMKSSNTSMKCRLWVPGVPPKRNERSDRKVCFIVTLLKYQAIPLTYL